jgi:hypothetical protein
MRFHGNLKEVGFNNYSPKVSSNQEEKVGRKTIQTIAIGVFFIILFISVQCLAMGKSIDVPRISKEQLRSMLGRPDVVILDVRIDSEWKTAKWKIKGAVRFDPEQNLDSLAEKYPKDKILVFYCS